MKNHQNLLAREKMNTISIDIKEILEFNDGRYDYLNINYGVYLMRFQNKNPTKFFNCIGNYPDTTETPFIYSQINLCASLLKFGKLKNALEINI